MKKKTVYLLFILLQVIFLGSLFLPIYTVNMKSWDVARSYKAMFYDSFNAQTEAFMRTACYIFFFVIVATVAFGIILLVMGLLAKEDEGDREDKFFVFGCFLGAISYAFMSMMQLGTSSFLVMALSLGYSILTAVMLYIHHRYLCSY